MRTREELEKLINDSAPALMAIDRAADEIRFRNERMVFLRHIASLMEIVRSDFKEIGFAICTTAIDCIKPGNYHPEKGPFLHYFNRALKRAVSKDEIQKAMLDRKKAEETNAQINGTDGMGTDELLHYVIDGRRALPDQVSDTVDSVAYLVRLVDLTFHRQQERTKPLLSKLLTIRLLDALLDCYAEAEDLSRDASFIDCQILTDYLSGKELPTARRVAELEHVAEQHACRSITNFLKKLMKNDKFAEACAYMNIKNA